MQPGRPTHRNAGLALRSAAVAVAIVVLYLVVVTRGSILHRLGVGL